MFMEELFWGCAGIGLAVVMPALALSAIGQAASPEQMLRVGARMLRHTRRSQAGRAGDLRTRGRQ